jgi:hypothetical protein
MIQVSPSNPCSSDAVVVSVEFIGCVDDASNITRSGHTLVAQLHFQPLCYATPPHGFYALTFGQ